MFLLSWIMGNWVYDQSIALIPEIEPIYEEARELVKLPTQQSAASLLALIKENPRSIKNKLPENNATNRATRGDLYQLQSGDDIFISKSSDI